MITHEIDRDAQEKFINDVINEAKEYAKSHICTYVDYERFKKILTDRNIYGFEGEIANALQL